MKNDDKHKWQKGQTLLEVVIALSIAVVVVGVIAIAVFSALDNAMFGKNQNQATQFAQEGLEVVRQQRDANLSAFNLLTGIYYCMDEDKVIRPKDQGVLNGCSYTGKQPPNGQNVKGFFAREVIITPNSCDDGNTATALLTKVEVVVAWSSSKCTSADPGKLYCHKVRLVSCFAN